MSKNSGFTLIELLVVIGIIAILSVLVVPNFMTARERARDIQRKSDIRQLQKALELYKDTQNPISYPATGSIPQPNNPWPDVANPSIIYMNDVPGDPTTGSSYNYAKGADNISYTLSACLENKADKDGSACVCSSSNWCYSVTQP